MIASRLGVAIAAGIALILAVVLGASRCTGRAEVPDRAVAGVDSAAITELAWTYADGTLPTKIVRLPASRTGWAWVAPAAVADADAIDATLSALRAARWHRRADGHVAGRARATLTITTASGAQTIEVGEPLAGGEQQWLRRGDDALLVDGWVARALVPDRLALRVRKPLANAASARDIHIVRGGTDLRMVGAPRSARGVLLSPMLVEAIHGVLADLALVRVADVPATAPRGLLVELDANAKVQEAGPCPGDPTALAVVTSDGDGCVAEAAWKAIAAAVDALGATQEELADPRPLPFDAARIELPDGTVLDLAKRPLVGDADADPVRVGELLATLVAPAASAGLPGAALQEGKLVVTDRAGNAHELHLYGKGIVARAGEPIALRIGDGAYALLVRPGAAYRDPALWTEEPTAIVAIAIGTTALRRGAVLGEWTHTGPGRDDPRGADRLAELLGKLRAVDAVADAQPPRRVELMLTIATPNGSMTQRPLTLLATPTTCRIEAPTLKGTHTVATELCQLADRLATP